MVTKQKFITAFTYTAVLVLGVIIGSIFNDTDEKSNKRLKSNSDRLETMMLRYEIIETKLDRIHDQVHELKRTTNKKKRKR
tara:strand:- start:828 stop:1070 length:243 start_codon:yes stop_codon:yes gene_type:complete